MKPTLPFVALALLCAFGSRPCFAEMAIERVSKERAKALGVEFRAVGNGPEEVYVEMAFKAEGDLKAFNHVSLEIDQGDRFELGYAALREKRPGDGRIVVGFLANREFLRKVTLRIVTGPDEDRGGHDLRVTDHVDVTKPK
jgi:hypothetical protein